MSKKYAYTDTLQGLLPKLTQEQVDQVHNEIDFHIENYDGLKKEHGAATTVANYLLEVERLIQEENKNNPIAKTVTCGKGCAHCCKMIAHVTEDEAELLVAVMKEDGIEIDRNKLATQASWEENEWTDKTIEEKACIFLDENDACKVYEYRPMNCRKLMVVTDPIMCDTVKFKNGLVKRFINI